MHENVIMKPKFGTTIIYQKGRVHQKIDLGKLQMSFSLPASERELMSRIYKELKTLVTKNINNPV